MKWLEDFGFNKSDIEEYENNTPSKMKELIMNNLDLVKENLKYISSLGIDTYKEIFINYPDKFLLDNSVFVEIFSKYETNELIEKLNANYKLIEYL